MNTRENISSEALRAIQSSGGVVFCNILKKEISLIGKITLPVADQFLSALRSFEDKKTKLIVIRINVYGGILGAIDNPVGRVYKAIDEIPFETEGFVSRFAYSGGALVLQACDYRTCHPNGIIMIHWPEPLDSNGKLINGNISQELLARQREAKKYWFEIFAERSGQSVRKIQFLSDRKIGATEALKYHLIDEINKKPLRP